MQQDIIRYSTEFLSNRLKLYNIKFDKYSSFLSGSMLLSYTVSNQGIFTNIYIFSFIDKEDYDNNSLGDINLIDEDLKCGYISKLDNYSLKSDCSKFKRLEKIKLLKKSRYV